MPYELLLLRLIRASTIFKSGAVYLALGLLLFGFLNGEETPDKYVFQNHLTNRFFASSSLTHHLGVGSPLPNALGALPLIQSSSREEVLELFFRNLLENTTAGYLLYGDKPVDLQGFLSLEKSIPGTKERRFSAITLLALRYLKDLVPLSKKPNYLFLNFPTPEGGELTLINRKAFLDVFRANSILFEYKFGVDLTPEALLDRLIQTGFCLQFKECIALQGIVLGYGIENAISYENGVSILKELKLKISLPEKSPSDCKNREEVLLRLKEQKMANHLEDLTYYQPMHAGDRLKVPFSFLKNSKKSKAILNLYEKYQRNVEVVLKRRYFLKEILGRLGLKPPSFCPPPVFSEEDYPRIIAQIILKTYPDQISPSFFEGMRAAETGEEIDGSDVKFLDLLWQRDQSKLRPTRDFFSKIRGENKWDCLVPDKLYFKTVRESSSVRILTDKHHSIQAHYLFRDLHGNSLGGSYCMEPPSLLHLDSIISGLSHGLLGMREGEIREVLIHPDFVYGASSDFGNGQAVIVTVELIRLDEPNETAVFPLLNPVDVQHYAPNIRSCSEFNAIEEKHAYACGFRSWSYYRESLQSLNQVIAEMKKGKVGILSDSDEHLLLQLEYFLSSRN